MAAFLLLIHNNLEALKGFTEQQLPGRIERGQPAELNDFLRAPDPAPEDYHEDSDDTVRLPVLCCHPALTPASQIALTLRSVGGLTTAEVAAALLVSETTVAQRISRAKRQIAGAASSYRRLRSTAYGCAPYCKCST